MATETKAEVPVQTVQQSPIDNSPIHNGAVHNGVARDGPIHDVHRDSADAEKLEASAGFRERVSAILNSSLLSLQNAN
jgi:hypothetical protein